jgi:hypothetical protein
MAFKHVLGRFLLVLGCLLAGAMKLVDPAHSEKLLISSYSKFFSKSKELGLPLPLEPLMVSTYSKELITLTGVLLIVGSLLTIFRSKLGVYLITLLYASFCLIVHLPILHTNTQEWNLNFYNLLLNLTTIAGLWLTCTTDLPKTQTTKSTSPTPQSKKDKSTWQRKKKE